MCDSILQVVKGETSPEFKAMWRKIEEEQALERAAEGPKDWNPTEEAAPEEDG